MIAAARGALNVEGLADGDNCACGHPVAQFQLDESYRFRVAYIHAGCGRLSYLYGVIVALAEEFGRD
jgi:hypothetical protein